MKPVKFANFLLLFLTIVLLGACANSGSTLPNTAPQGRIQACKSGDTEVASEADCLQDDAACYALDNGRFCTGERGNVCPAGSSPIAAGSACPAGGNCIRISDSLECMITVGG
ncbi:MAG: hypothetical protein V3U76_20260 [Granulosicoccus sp.]